MEASLSACDREQYGERGRGEEEESMREEEGGGRSGVVEVEASLSAGDRQGGGGGRRRARARLGKRREGRDVAVESGTCHKPQLNDQYSRKDTLPCSCLTPPPNTSRIVSYPHPHPRSRRESPAATM